MVRLVEFYQACAKHGRQPAARAKLGLLTHSEDTIPTPVDSIKAPKMYILEKRILGTQILMLGFVD